MLRWLDELSGQGVFITDTELVVRSWNRWLERFTALTSANVIGRPLLQLFPDLAMRGLAAHYRAALSGEVSVLSHRLHGHLLRMPQSRKDGSSEFMPQSARIAPLIDDGQVVGTITVIDDVTERVTSELELRRQIADAERARLQAEEASRVKEEFLATLSHEIRTPLNAVIGWIKILRGRPVDAATLTRALEVIDRNATAQAVLIEDMLDMARIVSGKLRLDIGTVDPVAATLAAVDVVAPAAAAKGISLRTSISPGLPSIRGDAGRMQQIIWNVLANAVKFTPTGGVVHVRAEAARRVNRHCCRGHRRGDCRGFSALHLRSFPSGDVIREPAPGRTGPRPGAGPAAGRDAGRPGERQQPRPRPGLRLPDCVSRRYFAVADGRG